MRCRAGEDEAGIVHIVTGGAGAAQPAGILRHQQYRSTVGQGVHGIKDGMHASTGTTSQQGSCSSRPAAGAQYMASRHKDQQARVIPGQ